MRGVYVDDYVPLVFMWLCCVGLFLLWFVLYYVLVLAGIWFADLVWCGLFVMIVWLGLYV